MSGMKKWKILFNIIMETVIFFGIAVLLIIGIPKLMGFFWPFVASWILALLATPLCNFLEKHIKLNKKMVFSGNHCTCFAGTGGNRLSGSDKAWTGTDGIVFRSARILCLCAENN